MKKLLLIPLIFILILPALWNTKPGEAQSENAIETNFTLKEGNDFATRILADPWDMTNYADISQGLNLSPGNYLDNIQVSNSLFSAHTLGNYSDFYPLFPGYEPAVNSGKIGARFPINSSSYACAYVAMTASWSGSDNNALVLFWARDRSLDRSGVWGQTIAGMIPHNDEWRLYSLNLSTHPSFVNQRWSSQPYWQAFRVSPSLIAGTQFSVDWVRLTNCEPVVATLSGLSSGSYSLWIGTGAPEHQILAVPTFSPTNGSYAWDVQGLAAGSYNYYVKASGGNTVQSGILNIIGSPIVTFTSPSQYSGQDYANRQGNPWDMDSSDAFGIRCVSYAGFNNGILTLDTQSQACAGPGANEADPIFYLNIPDHGDMSSYRYLSFSGSTTGYPWSVPQLGMIVRLFWSLDRPGSDCWYGSRSIALDLGGQTYAVDLYDPWNGIPEEKTPADCPLVSWRDQAAVGPLVSLRVDPNENITGGVLHQEFDWIRLTKIEQVSQGKPAKIRVMLNKPASEVSLNFYYTTDLAQQTQNLASPYAATVLAAPHILYMPRIFTFDPFYDFFVDQIPANVTFSWNTNGVAPGEYYVCAQADDGYNQATYCSQAPIKINP